MILIEGVGSLRCIRVVLIRKVDWIWWVLGIRRCIYNVNLNIMVFLFLLESLSKCWWRLGSFGYVDFYREIYINFDFVFF